MAFRSEFICILIVLNICTLGYSRLAPDFIQPCSDTTTECLTRAANIALPEFVKGMPHLGVPSLDPFEIDEIPLNLFGIKAVLHEGVATGFKTCIVDKVTYDLSTKIFGLNVVCNLTIQGPYTAKGKLLMFLIDGSGYARVDLTNLRVQMTIKAKHVRDSEGRKHFNVKSYKYDFDYGDHVAFNITNIFRDSQEISDAILMFINENWRHVTQAFGKPIVDTAVDIAVRTVEKFYHAVPCEEILYVEIPDKK